MKRLWTVAALALAAGGCLGPVEVSRSAWVVESVVKPHAAVAPLFEGDVKVMSVSVRPPYDGERIAVLRPDGTVAFDPLNVFAASPARMLAGPAADGLFSAGLFGRAFTAYSSAKTRYGLDMEVSKLALDCRDKGSRTATVELSATLLDGRECVAVGFGRGTCATDDGDYSAAFSDAFSAAFEAACRNLADRR